MTAQIKTLDERSKATGKWSDAEIAVIADALGESRMYPSSRFPRKMQLYKRAIEDGTRFNEAWNLELRKRKTVRRNSANYSWHDEERNEEDDQEEYEDEAETRERKGYHREHGDWGGLLDQDGEEVEEDLSREGSNDGSGPQIHLEGGSPILRIHPGRGVPVSAELAQRRSTGRVPSPSSLWHLT